MQISKPCFSFAVSNNNQTAHTMRTFILTLKFALALYSFGTVLAVISIADESNAIPAAVICLMAFAVGCILMQNILKTENK